MTRTLLLSSAAVLALTTGALAADLPTTKGPPVYAPPPPPAFTWSGFYVGGQLGYQWGQSRSSYIFDETNPSNTLPISGFAHNDSGIVGGGHIGFNYQVSQFVFGIEGDVDGSSYRGSATNAFLATEVESTRIPIEGSVRGRIGFAFDRVLIYGTGGAEFASVRSGFDPIAFPAFNTSTTNGRVGWTVGGGIEYAIDNNWSIRAEYRYADLGRVNYAITGLPAPFNTLGFSKRITENIATAGFSYKFDMFAPPAPVVAKY